MSASTTPLDPSALQDDLRLLRSPSTIRERSLQLFQRIAEGSSDYFALVPERWDDATNFVLDEIRTNYPDLRVPYHSRLRHFDAGGIERTSWLADRLHDIDPAERVRLWFDLLIPSVLLDAGAGSAWSWTEDHPLATSIRASSPPSLPSTFSRSEGLAVASFYLFLDGFFSSDPSKPWQTDAHRLLSLSSDAIARGFQVSPTNPLVGLEGRSSLLRSLGQSLLARPDLFGSSPARPGHLYDHLLTQIHQGHLSAPSVFSSLLDGFQAIWPSRLSLGGINLGDVWNHPAISGPGYTDHLIPFHKLTSWLTYSLLEPLQNAGIAISDLHDLTGLPEYRNGGLLLDIGLLRLKQPPPADGYPPQHPCIVEWRAATVILLDSLAAKIRARLGLDEDRLPLVAVLQGGTWSAGRRIARLLRPDGSPPLSLQSDGTVF